MQTRLETDAASNPTYVSTGRLPSPEQVKVLVAEAYERYQADGDGQNSQVYPALARLPRELFGICVVGTSGSIYAVRDAGYEFTIMGVSKPFVFALVCQAVGVEEVRQRIGVNATGLAFNSLAVMLTAGLYETSGDWLYDIGLPGKSGIGGGIVAVSPGKGGLGTFAPPLDQAGNSVKGQLVAKFLPQRVGLDLLVSRPEA